MMKVKAMTGVRVPMEDAPHKYITDSEIVEVERTLYYLRRMADGDLVEVVESAKAKVDAKTDNTTKGAA